METLNLKKDGNKVLLLVDSEECGFLEIAAEGFGAYRIENVRIDTGYRGKGLYKAMLIASFNFFKIDTLLSYNRNDKSNSIYENWTGVDLDRGDQVYIQLLGEKLEFTVDL